MKAEAIMLFKEDVLTLGRLVERTVEEMLRMLRKDPNADLFLIEQRRLLSIACSLRLKKNAWTCCWKRTC